MNDTMYIDGTALSIRPIQIADAERLARMFERLSRHSIYFRFFSPISRLPRSTLLHLADVDHRRRDAIVALDGNEIVAVARYDSLATPGAARAREAEIAITVEDSWQHRGIGRRLSRRLGALACQRGYHALIARVLPDNRAALALVRRLAPDASLKFEGGDYEARVPLRPFC